MGEYLAILCNKLTILRKTDDGIANKIKMIAEIDLANSENIDC